MKFTVLRKLKHSELGMFYAYREDGREIAKQRAINFDAGVVDRLFPAAKDDQVIPIHCTYLENNSDLIEVKQKLTRQDKNWRFEGCCPKSRYFKFVTPGVLFAMAIDSSTTPANASWVVIPMDHPARNEILNHGECSRMNKSPMIALYANEGKHTAQVLTKYFPEVFAPMKLTAKKLMANRMDDDENGPDPEGTFELLGRTGHSLHSAIADLIDNSISANATEVRIFFPDPNVSGHWMSILDNGKGMSPEKLRLAMKVGKRQEYESNDLGKFGYGLKGASWSQADCLTVVTKAKSHPQAIATWDKSHLVKCGKWEMLNAPVEKKYTEATKITDTGTAVLLTIVRPSQESEAKGQLTNYDAKLIRIKKHVELVFHRFLEGTARGRAKVRIWLNDIMLAANNPMGHELTKPLEKKEVQLPDVGNAKIYLQAYVLPSEEEFKGFYITKTPQEEKTARERLLANLSKNKAQGIYFYRNDRLIKWGGWNEIWTEDEHTKLLRMSLDFDEKTTNFLQVDISKQLVSLPPNLFDPIKSYLKPALAEARRRYKQKTATAPTGGEKKTATTTKSDGSPTVTVPKPSGSMPKPAKATKSPIRLVESGDKPWVRKNGFAGEHVEVTPKIPELVALVKVIIDNMEAKTALNQFLQVLENKNVMTLFKDV